MILKPTTVGMANDFYLRNVSRLNACREITISCSKKDIISSCVGWFLLLSCVETHIIRLLMY